MDWLKLALDKYRRFWALDGQSRKLFLQAFLLLPLVALSLKFLGLNRTQTALVRLLPAATLPLASLVPRPEVVKTIWMVQLAAKHCQLWANCLKKSLVLWALLRHQGIESDLRIGVRREIGHFEAHAWVECEGVALNDMPDVRSRFAMFDSSIEMHIES